MDIAEILKKRVLPNFKPPNREAEGLEPYALELATYIKKSLAWSIVRNPKYTTNDITELLNRFRKGRKVSNAMATINGIRKDRLEKKH